MADGNVGSLWVSLGVKDEMTKALEKIVKGMNGVDDAAKAARKRGEELMKSLEGVNGVNFARVFREANEYIAKNSEGINGVAKILKSLNGKDIFTGEMFKAKNITKAAEVLRKVNAELATMATKEDTADDVKTWRSRISNALDYVKLLQEINVQEKRVNGAKTLNPNVDTKSLDNAKKSLEGLRGEMVKLLQSGGVDNSNVLGGFKKLLEVAKKEVQDIVATFKKENPLSQFSGGAAKVEADIARVGEKLARLRDLMAEGAGKGYKTGMLGGSIAELDNIMARLNAAKLNPTMLTDVSQMRNLISDVLVEMTKATVAEMAYRREKSKTIEVERAVNQEIANEHKAAQQERKRDLKALSDYTKRYMKLQEEKRKAEERAAKDAKDKARRQSEAEQRRIASDTAKMSRLYASMGLGIGKGERVGMRGLELGVDTAALAKALSEAAKFKRTIENTVVSMMGKGDRPAYEWYAAQVNRLKEKLANATAAQKELNAVQEKANKKAASDNAKRRAEEKRREAQATRELAQAEKQRQIQLEITRSRIQSMERALHNLQEKRFTAKMLGIDTSEANAKIEHLKTQLMGLRNIQLGLGMGDTSFLGRVGNLGNGREVQAANQLAGTYSRLIGEVDKTNREKAKSVEIERKHQQEVAKTAAKVRGDLAKAFEQAKNHASGMNSTMQDLKSLFMQGGIVFGAQQFLMSVIQTGGELEKQHIALQSILGDMQNANTMFGQVKELALSSPFTFSELNKDVKQLAAYGVEYNDLYDTTKRLADMASGLGVSFERIALAFGQVQARGWLDGKELRQIAYAGIPLLDKLSDYYSKREGRNVSTSEIKTRISGRGVSFEDVKNIFWEMTDAGGQFYNMQQVLSETLLGRYNKLKDAWEIMLSDFASGNNVVGKGLKGIIDLVTELVQSLHTLAPVVAAAFAGPMLRRMQTMLGGGLDKTLLGVKGQMANELSRRAMEGQKLNDVERKILQTKNQITGVEIRNLAKANALTQTELKRLYVAGKITKQMYLQGMALAKQNAQTKSQSMWGMLSGWGSGAKWGALGGLIGGGLKSLASSVLGFFGGLPGIAISAGLSIFAWYEQKNSELNQKMDQTSDELKDRAKQMGEFLRDNNVGKTIAGGDEKEISNMIDAYKDKIREISPLSADMFVMKADEKESHEERLRYLADQLKLLQESNKVAQEKLNDVSIYKSADMSKARKAAEDMVNAAVRTRMYNATKTDFDEYKDAKKSFDEYVEGQKQFYLRTFPALLNSPQQQEAYKAMRDNMLAGSGATEEQARAIRSALDTALGLKDSTVEKAFSEKLLEMVDKSFPEIGNRIRAHKELDEESKKKVTNLMKGAKAQLQIEYPYWEASLQNMLKASNFEAVIRLTYQNATPLSDLEGQVYNNMVPGMLSTGSDEWKKQSKLYGVLKPFLKGVNDYVTATNNAKSELDKRFGEMTRRGEMLKKGKMTQGQYDESKKAYEDLKKAVKDGLGYEYVPTGKKGSAKGGRKGGRDKDEELEELKRQLEDFKAARQAYQKLRNEAGMSKQRAKNEVVGLYKDLDWKKINLDDYPGSLERLKEGFNFGKSKERQKFRTQIDRERFDWKLSEQMKPEWERVAANFKEALEKGVRQADLEKELYEKTGNKGFASLAWKDGAVWTEQARRMADDFKKRFGEDVDLGLTDADAKAHFKDVPLAYDAWSKIVQIVKDGYVKSLQQAADIMEKTATTEEKVRTASAKYEIPIRQAEDAGNRSLAERYRQTRDKETGRIRSEAFKQSEDYLAFYEAIMTMGMGKAEEVAKLIREQLNQALKDGSIDAREYAKQIAQVEQQLDKLGSGRKTLWNSGFTGVAEGKIERGEAQRNLGSIKMGEGERLIREGKIDGDTQKVLKGEGLKLAGKVLFNAGDKLYLAGREIKKDWESAVKTVDKIDNVAQGLNNAFNDVRDTMGALGFDTESDGWQDAAAVMGSLSGVSSSISGIVKSAATGDIGGVIQGAVGVFTSPIKAFAAAHDAKLDRQIKLAERSITELERMRSNVKSILENTLGGVYTYEMDKDTKATLSRVAKDYSDGKKTQELLRTALGGANVRNRSVYSEETYKAAQESLADPTNAYKAQYASLMAQKDALQKQMNAESSKKKKDKDKIADYKQQQIELEMTLKNFSTSFLKDIYGVDMKSWASQLTDAVVSAWEKGEDAIDAYKKKAREMVKDLTKNILSQKIMEAALKKPLDSLTDIIEKKGKLEDTDLPQLLDGLNTAGENATYNITKILDGLKAQGYDFTASGSGGSTTNSIKNVTEETAGLLASYMNQIRQDCSVNRANVKTIAELMKNQLPELGQIQKAQLGQMTQLVTLAEARNEKLDKMMDWMTAVTTSGRKKVNVS